MLESTDIPDYRSLKQSSETHTPQIILHDSLGDLSSHTAFIMRGLDKKRFKHTETNPLYIHLSVTGRCQASCQGCINTAFNGTANDSERSRTSFKDTDPVRDARCIINLVRENPSETVTVCFYGGEPLLAVDKMHSLIENINNGGLPNHIRYMLYTNGEFLGKAAVSYPELLKRIWLYSVSIDGTRMQHERIRRGTHLDRIHEGLAALKDIRQGQVLMWSTLREDQSLLDCFDEFMHLYEKGLVEQFFWHWVETGDPFVSLASYAAHYEKDLQEIMGIYVEKLKGGILLPITHINDLVLYLLSGKKRKSTACGVELARNYDIVDGRIHSCADLPAQYSIGTISEDGTPIIKSQDLAWLTIYKNDLGCTKCGVHSYCGGRCPVQAITGSVERLKQYCQLMRLHVSIVNYHIEDIVSALETNKLSAQDIYDQSAFYVQFTDGTP